MLTKLTLRNFRGFENHEIPLREMTVIVGRNNAGKSTVVEALRLIYLRVIIASKGPQSDVQFATAVAYYYRFEVAEAQQKLAITAEDLQDAALKVDRDRLTKPSQTLVNAYHQGLLDKLVSVERIASTALVRT